MSKIFLLRTDFKGTVNVILSDPPYKDILKCPIYNVMLETLIDKNCGRLRSFSDSKIVYFCVFLNCFLLARNSNLTFSEKLGYLIHNKSDKDIL